MDHASRGAAALSASDIPTALSAFTQALIQHPTSPDYFVQRATAFTRLTPPRHDLALKDAEYAVLLGQKRAKREKIQAAQQRRVISLYGQGRYADAKFLLESMKKWRNPENKKDKMEGDIWMAKVDQKSKSAGSNEATTVTVTEYPDVDLPNEKIMKQWLSSQLKADETYRFDGEVDTTTAKPAAKNTDTTSHTAPSITAPSATTSMNGTSSTTSKVRHEWYQNTDNVIITIYAKGVAEDVAQSGVDIQSNSVSLSFPDPTVQDTTYNLAIAPLYASIIPSSSTTSVKSTKIEISLRKSTPGQKWSNLQGTSTVEPTSANNVVTPSPLQPSTTTATDPLTTTKFKDTPPSYPTSSRSGPKDWDKLASDLTSKKPSTTKKSKSKPSTSSDNTTTSKPRNDSSSSEADEAADSDLESGDAVDSFFKKLYAGADPDTRRAMMKSFQESNGTALSTNWAEVGKKKVEEVKGKDD